MLVPPRAVIPSRNSVASLRVARDLRTGWAANGSTPSLYRMTLKASPSSRPASTWWAASRTCASFSPRMLPERSMTMVTSRLRPAESGLAA